MEDNGFLVLERKVNQSVVIDTSDGRIEVTITAIRTEDGRKSKVKLGISAPKGNLVLRKEKA